MILNNFTFLPVLQPPPPATHAAQLEHPWPLSYQCSQKSSFLLSEPGPNISGWLSAPYNLAYVQLSPLPQFMPIFLSVEHLPVSSANHILPDLGAFGCIIPPPPGTVTSHDHSAPPALYEAEQTHPVGLRCITLQWGSLAGYPSLHTSPGANAPSSHLPDSIFFLNYRTYHTFGLFDPFLMLFYCVKYIYTHLFVNKSTGEEPFLTPLTSRLLGLSHKVPRLRTDWWILL